MTRSCDLNTKDRAIYLPALNSCFLNGTQDEYIKGRNRWQPHFQDHQFEIFHPDCPVYCKRSLLSAGHEPYKRVEAQYECIRARAKDTVLVGDSGGFQIATDKLKIDWAHQENVDAVRLGILRFLEANCDIAMTLDVPTFTIGREGFKFQTFDQCLEQTLDNMEYWMAHRDPDSKLQLLNVLQGRTEDEVDLWYSKVKHYNTRGWSFSSANSDCVYYMIRSALMLARDGELNADKNWIHVLGRTMPAVSVILSDLQNRISDLVENKIQISYDSSSFVQAAITGSILDHTMSGELKIRTSKIDMSYLGINGKSMTLNEYVGNDSKFGDAIRLEHMYIWHDKEEKWYWDVPTYAQVMAYNYEVTCNLMNQAHDMYEADQICGPLLRVKHEILPAVFSKETIPEMIAELTRYKRFLSTEILKYDEPVQLADNGLFDW